MSEEKRRKRLTELHAKVKDLKNPTLDSVLAVVIDSHPMLTNATKKDYAVTLLRILKKG
jgi:hypothetical protein